MTQTYKILGQLYLTGNTSGILYTVPAAAQCVVSTITACNHFTGESRVSVTIHLTGEADASKQYIYREIPLPRYDTYTLNIGITLSGADQIRALQHTPNASGSFNAFGSEVT